MGTGSRSRERVAGPTGSRHFTPDDLNPTGVIENCWESPGNEFLGTELVVHLADGFSVKLVPTNSLRTISTEANMMGTTF